MKIALITGSWGLIGSEAVEFFADKGFDVIGIDNDMRRYFFGEEASTSSKNDYLKQKNIKYKHFNIDIRDKDQLEKIFKEYNSDIQLIIHTAAQPSHDWAAKEPLTDFGINATGTLNLLEMARLHCQEAVFIFTSTNKVYGDLPNKLPLIECESRWDLPEEHVLLDNGLIFDMDQWHLQRFDTSTNRVWIYLSRVDVDVKKHITKALDKRGKSLVKIEKSGALLYLYEVQ